jgi:ATP-dependent DNA ligase
MLPWQYPMKPVRVDETIFSKINCSEYTMERKLDGFRSLLVVNGDGQQLWTRHKTKIQVSQDVLNNLRTLNLPKDTVLDGEIWSMTSRGGWHKPNLNGDRLTEVRLGIWDVLWISGKYLGSLPLVKRQEELRKLIPDNFSGIEIVKSLDTSIENYSMIRQEAKDFQKSYMIRSGNIHGVVIKKKNSRRHDHPNRSIEHSDWLKILIEGMQSGQIK